MPIESQIAYVNNRYFYRIPHNAFNVSESIANSLVYSATNLPSSFEVEGRTISGVPTATGEWDIEIKASYDDLFALNSYKLNVEEDPGSRILKEVKEGEALSYNFAEGLTSPQCKAKVNGEKISDILNQQTWIVKVGSMISINPTLDHIGRYEIEMDCSGFIDGRSVDIVRVMELKVKGLKVLMDGEVDCEEDKICKLPKVLLESEEENIRFVVRSRGEGIKSINGGEYEGSDPEKAMEELEIVFRDNYNGETLLEIVMEDNEGSRWSKEIKVNIKNVNDLPRVKGVVGKKVLEEGKVGVYSVDIYEDVDGDEVEVELEGEPSFVEYNKVKKEMVVKPMMGSEGEYDIRIVGNDGVGNTTAKMLLEVFKFDQEVGESNNTNYIIGGAVGGSVAVVSTVVLGLFLKKRIKEHERDIELLTYAVTKVMRDKSDGHKEELKNAGYLEFVDDATQEERSEKEALKRELPEGAEVSWEKTCLGDLKDKRNKKQESGAFGNVREEYLKNRDGVLYESFVENENDGSVIKVASKTIKSSVNSLKKRAWWREARIMNMLHHPNITKFVGVCFSPPTIYMEYIEEGDMKAYMGKKKREEEGRGGRLKEREMLSYLLDIARGLEYLYEVRVVHRDLTLENCLKGNDMVKIADLGLAEKLEEGEESVDVTGKFGKKNIAALEVFEENRHYIESDMWSMGVLILSMSEGGEVRGYKDKAEDDINADLLEEEEPGVVDSYYEKMKELAEECWERDRAKRIGYSDMVRRLEEMLNREVANEAEEDNTVNTTSTGMLLNNIQLNMESSTFEIDDSSSTKKLVG